MLNTIKKLFKSENHFEYQPISFKDLTLDERLEFTGFVNNLPALKDAIYGADLGARKLGNFDLIAVECALSAFYYACVDNAEYSVFNDTVYLTDLGVSYVGYEYQIKGYIVIRQRVYLSSVLDYFIGTFL